MDDPPDILWENTENVAALGAAELAKRAPWDPYKLLIDPMTLQTFGAVNAHRDKDRI